MATVEITQRALAKLERLFDFIAAENPQRTRGHILSVRKVFEVLADHPLLARALRRAGASSSCCAVVMDTRKSSEAGYAGEYAGLWLLAAKSL